MTYRIHTSDLDRKDGQHVLHHTVCIARTKKRPKKRNRERTLKWSNEGSTTQSKRETSPPPPPSTRVLPAGVVCTAPSTSVLLPQRPPTRPQGPGVRAWVRWVVVVVVDVRLRSPSARKKVVLGVHVNVHGCGHPSIFFVILVPGVPGSRVVLLCSVRFDKILDPVPVVKLFESQKATVVFPSLSSFGNSGR